MMRSVIRRCRNSVWSYPKVNLALDILRNSHAGYHEIQTVFHQLGEPRDEICIEAWAEDGILVQCDNFRVPTDDANTVHKAITFLKQHIGVREGVKIFIKKKIPVAGGLGGGSSNAVAALRGLGKLWGVSEKVLKNMANQIGMDCAFFFDGGTALGEHFGEKITPLPSLPKPLKFELIETGVEISSRWAYEQIDIRRCGKNRGQTKKILEALRAQDPAGILKNLHNDFEEFIFEESPELLRKKREIEAKKTGRVLLCGSGGCLVRVYSG